MKKLILFLFIICLTLPALAADKVQVNNDDFGVWVFKINLKKYGKKIKPFYTDKLTTPKKVYDDNCFDLVVNGGFFDVQNGKSVSYVTIDGAEVLDPNSHVVLIENLKKQDRLDKVLSRAEFRILENRRGKLKFDIARHNDPIEKKYHIKHSLQAGPEIYPCIDLEGEGFIRIENDIAYDLGVDILKRRERTALALKGKYLYIVIFTRDHKVDAKEMREYLINNLKVEKAMALDGGLSTAINYKDISIGSLGKYQRRVKSFLVIER